nr:MAG TPA: hypothetical protein [Caudoviricetes sp.]
MKFLTNPAAGCKALRVLRFRLREMFGNLYPTYDNPLSFWIPCGPR